MNGLAVSVVAAAALLVALPAAAGGLSKDGVALGRVKVASLTDGLRVTVDLGGDAPTASHVIARFQNNQPLMRGADGLWAPWNGDPQSLDEAGATAERGTLTFRVLDTPPGGLFFPVSFTVVYRTSDALKSGTIIVDGP